MKSLLVGGGHVDLNISSSGRDRAAGRSLWGGMQEIHLTYIITLYRQELLFQITQTTHLDRLILPQSCHYLFQDQFPWGFSNYFEQSYKSLIGGSSSKSWRATLVPYSLSFSFCKLYYLAKMNWRRPAWNLRHSSKVTDRHQVEEYLLTRRPQVRYGHLILHCDAHSYREIHVHYEMFCICCCLSIYEHLKLWFACKPWD